MGFIKVYEGEGDKQIVTVSLQEQETPRRLPSWSLLAAIAVVLGIEIALVVCLIHIFLG